MSVWAGSATAGALGAIATPLRFLTILKDCVGNHEEIPGQSCPGRGPIRCRLGGAQNLSAVSYQRLTGAVASTQPIE